jgi:4-amino-4-deoxy-L-arabinose transferase-like glycosyltransferase
MRRTRGWDLLPAVDVATTRLARSVLVIAAIQLVVLLVTSSRYGYHRDEMYFIVSGGHPAFGYPDQPALVPLLAWLMHQLAPGSLPVLRLPSALAATATTLLAGDIAREVGGGITAQRIAAACTAVSAFTLATGHFVTTTTFDLLATTALCWLVIRAVSRHRPRFLLLAGLAVGLGTEAKPQVALVAAVLVAALAVVGPRWPLGSPSLWAGIAIAVLLAAPYVVWQAAHHWPQVTVIDNIGGSAEGGRIGFVPFQLVLVSPVLVPVWVAGLIAPWRSSAASVYRRLRFLPVTYGVVALLYLLGDGKAYYLASLYPTMLGIGGLPVARWLAKGRERLRRRVLVAAIALSAAVSALIALPLLPASALQGSAVMALNPDQGETVGWQRFVGTVDRVWRSVPAAERPHTVIFTHNYGEAGAIDVLDGSAGLPRAYSGHNAYALWGRPGDGATQVVLVGYQDATDAAPYFTDCRRRATIDDGVGLDNDEQGLPVMLCRPSESWSRLWPQLRHYD